MFAVLHKLPNSILTEWKCSTDVDGKLRTYDFLEQAQKRVRELREQGGEACLVVIVD